MLVLGGHGFVGRHAVAALRGRNCNVTIGTRFPRSPAERRARLHELLDPESWRTLIDDVDVVLNCVGILRQRGRQTYRRVHHLSPAALCAACRDAGKRFVHVTALGLHAEAGSRFITSKLSGEVAIMANGGDYIIARPSLIDGEGGFGARWLRGVSRLPFFLAPMDATGKIAALDAEDLGEALARLCTAPADALELERSREFDLGGTTTYAFSDYIRGLRRRYTDEPNLRVPVPGVLARLFAHFCDVIHFTPFSYGHWELLRRDNVPAENRLPELLGRAPREVVSPDSKQ